MATIQIKLGARPKTIHRIVKVPLPEGGEGVIEVDFKYRTRREYAALVDEFLAANSPLAKPAQDEADADTPAPVTTVAGIADETVRRNARDLLRVIDGWSLDVDLSEESLDQLCDEFPGVAEQLMNAYRTALTEGRSGN